jgi:tetratricopeptide (TPR) repeat protein
MKMDTEMPAIAQIKYDQAQEELGKNNVLAALVCMEIATHCWNNPLWYSCLGYCIANQRGNLTRAFELCRTAIEHDRGNPLHYLYLGKVYLHAGEKDKALQAFQQGMNLGGTLELERILESFGVRKSPVIPFLSRDNLLNKFLGILLYRFNLRLGRSIKV